MRTPGKYIRPHQIYNQVKCRLCKKLIEDEEEYVITSDFFQPEDALWPFANAAMHSKCFFLWEKRDEFLLPKDVVRQYQMTPNFVRILLLYRKAE